jgi:signal transduction histidine kinase
MNSRELFLYDRIIKSEVITMIYRNLMTLIAASTLILGIFFCLWGPMVLPYLGDGSMPEIGATTVGNAISFTRLFGAMLLTVGFIAWAVRKLDRPEDQRSIGLAFFIGSLFLLFIALTQKFTIWAPNSGWIAIFIIAMLPLSFGYMLFVEFDLTDFRPLTLSQDPEKLRQRWVRQLSEAAAQQERNRLARDLHDSIKQQIFSINVSAAAAQERWDKDSAGARQALEDVRNSAREAMTEMEAMLQQLRPAPLENIGLVEALRKQAEALQYRTGAYVTAEFSDLPDNDTLLPGAQEAIFRIAQEALSNIARHARAKNVHLRLYQQRDGENPVLWLKIEDDGSGFDTTRPGTGMGLANINVRAAEIGGRLHIESAPGEGTNLVVSIPIISPDVGKIRRMCYAHRTYAFAVVFIFAILFRYGNRTGDLLSRDSITILMLILLLPACFNARKEKKLLEKLRSTKNVPLKVSLGLTRDNYQTSFFVNTFLVTCGMPWTIPPRIFTQARLYYAIFLFTAVLGAALWSAMPRIHRIMKELKENISPIDLRQSTEQMWRQAIITLMIVIPLVIALSWWTHELQPLLLFTPLSALYLGYVAWWRHRSHSKTAQGA